MSGIFKLLIAFNFLLSSSGDLQTVQNDCVALVLARGGSKQLPRKNLVVVEGESLLARSIDIAKHANEIWVSTDDLEIYNEAVKAGAKVFGRSAETASDTASSLEAISEFYQFFPNITCICLLQCTSPFQSSLYLRDAYFKMIGFNYDSIFSAFHSHKLRWRKEKNETVAAINFDAKSRPRRQDVGKEYIENGMFYLFRTELLKQNLIQGGKVGIVEIPKLRSVEIDTFEDLMVANTLASIFLPRVKQEKFMCSLRELDRAS